MEQVPCSIHSCLLARLWGVAVCREQQERSPLCVPAMVRQSREGVPLLL